MADTSYQTLKSEYERLIRTMKIKSAWESQFVNTAKQIVANKARYEEVEAKTSVPWYFVGVIHSLECGLSFNKHLHNGDPLTRRTRLVPAGRPAKGSPPFSFLESAIDALQMKNFHKETDWSLSKIAWMLERYNGWGYRNHHPNTLSPYLWSGSYHYTSGKYIADGKWSSSAVSKQAGCMPLLRVILQIDAANNGKESLWKPV